MCHIALSSSLFVFCFFFQAEDGIRDLVRSRGLGDVYKRQGIPTAPSSRPSITRPSVRAIRSHVAVDPSSNAVACLLYTSDAADERSSVDLGGRRIIKKKTRRAERDQRMHN